MEGNPNESRAAPVPSIAAIDDPKVRKLVEILRGFGRAVVAYSGGVDSAFLLKAARDVLGESAIGVLATSESLDRNELAAARKVADAMGIPIRTIEVREYDNPEYRKNGPDRCYHCKTELFSRVIELARAEGIPWVLDGSNRDDLGDYRPGARARTEKGVRSPLQEAGITKEEIRRHSKALGVPTWDKPSAPCLASRIPYGSEVTDEKLRQVEGAEARLRALGFRECRVRHHGAVARIEVPAADIPRFLDEGTRAAVAAGIKAAGFLFVALDIQGLRSGSLNEAIGLAPAPAQAPIAPETIR
jgi:pyridinium-3,5-biscarboxylic acid mononucleotide sulfurtransferase